MMKKVVSWLLSVFKYIVALFMMFAGVQTMLLTREHDHPKNLGFIYENHWSLIVLGCIFFASGLVLFVGKLMKWRHVIGHGLMAVYSCFLFATIIQYIGYGAAGALPNFIAVLITGSLYLRWKYHIYYYEPPVDKVRKRMLEYEPLDEDRTE